MKSRREFLMKGAAAALGTIALSTVNTDLLARAASPILEPASPHDMPMPRLPYAYDALEPYIDKMTMEIHYSKHHQGYVNNLNKALNELGLGHSHLTAEQLCINVSKYNAAVRNNAGGHFNHSLFWSIMKPQGGGKPTGAVAEAITASFGSFDEMQKKFNDAAKSRFGSGWAWLVVRDGKLDIGSTANQDNPLMDISEFKGTPILALDVWEHAYYLKYQNLRGDYVSNWWNVVNWDEVNRRFAVSAK